MLKKNLEVFVKLFQVLFCGEKKICILDLNELVSWDSNFTALTQKYENVIYIPDLYFY